MKPKIEEMKQAKDVKGLIEALWSKDVRDVASALETIDDPGMVDPLIDFLKRRSEFMEWDMNRYKELWSDNPGMIDYRDSALADYQSVQFSAMRIFEKFGGENAMKYLEHMTDHDPDSDVCNDAGRHWRRLREKQAQLMLKGRGCALASLTIAGEHSNTRVLA